MAVFAVFLAVGTRAFGGPAAQISALSTEFIHERQWISVERFRRALAVCQILPGPEAHEMCCYLGVLRSGRDGGTWIHVARTGVDAHCIDRLRQRESA